MNTNQPEISPDYIFDRRQGSSNRRTRAILGFSSQTDELLAEYSRTLREYFFESSDIAFHRAQALGHEAVARGISAGTVAAVRHRAMLSLLFRLRKAEQIQHWLKASSLFCMACPSSSSGVAQRTDETGKAPMSAGAAGFPQPASPDLATGKTSSALHQLIELREQEARRIGQALHAESAQLLAAVHLALAPLADSLTPEQRKQLEKATRVLDQAAAHLRNLSHELYPAILNTMGLRPALDDLAEGVAQRSGIRVTVKSPLMPRLTPCSEIAIYRIVQEALNNAVRHARASRVRIVLEKRQRRMSCIICDNGMGFDVAEVAAKTRGLGLEVMREHARVLSGSIQLQSNPGEGTKIAVSIPLKSSWKTASVRTEAFSETNR